MLRLCYKSYSKNLTPISGIKIHIVVEPILKEYDDKLIQDNQLNLCVIYQNFIAQI